MPNHRKYTYPYLITFIDENKIITDKDTYLTRDSEIDFHCMKCNEVTSNIFRYIVEKNKIYCKDCGNYNKKFNYQYLTEFINEYNIITFKNKYLNRDSDIEFHCINCNVITIKIFRYLVEKSGPYCNECYQINNGNFYQNFNYQYLTEFIDKNKIITPLNTYLTRDSNIEFNCMNCNEITCKNFRCIVNLGGPYCENCTKFFRNEKVKDTYQKRYQVDNISKLESIKEKKKETTLKNHGVQHTFQSYELREKSRKTNIIKYGFPFPTQSPEVQEKRKQTTLLKYNVEHVMQNSDIAEKCLKSAYNKKIYTFPSGNEVIVQGYENFALDILLNNYKEEDLILKRADIPEIWYLDLYEPSKIRRYFPDIYIPKENLILEIKSTWTFEKDKQEVFAKKKAVQYLGYDYEIWIMTSKGDIIKKYDHQTIYL